MAKCRFLMGCGLLGMASFSHAYPTALFNMPIADILGHRQFLYYMGANGTERRVSKGYAWAHGVAFGLDDRLELGVDNDTLGNTWVHAKILLYEAKDPAKFACSAGVMNVPLKGGTSAAYFVGRTNLNANVRLHAGWMHDDRHRLMAGMDFNLGKGYSAAIERISGPGQITWAALNIPLAGPNLVLTAAVGVPDRSREGVQHNLTLNYGFKL